MTSLVALAGWEIRAAARSRWMVGSTVVFAAAVTGVIVLGLRGSRDLGLPGLGPTSTGLIGIGVLLPSLLGLLAGAAALAGARERGDLAMMLVQPLGRGSLVTGLFVGLASVLGMIVVAGFGVAIALAATQLRAQDLTQLLGLVGATVAVAAAGVAIGVFLSALARSRAQATALAVVVWFVLALGFDVVLAGLIPAAHMGPGALLTTILFNPIETARVLALLGAGAGGTALGPFGAYLTASAGAGSGAAVLGCALLLWIVVPLLGARWLLSHRDA